MIFQKLPPHLDASDPRTIAWEVGRTQTVVEDHAERIEALEDRQHQLPERMIAAFPWRKLAVLAVPLALFLAGILSREQARDLFLRMLGIVL